MGVAEISGLRMLRFGDARSKAQGFRVPGLEFWGLGARTVVYGDRWGQSFSQSTLLLPRMDMR